MATVILTNASVSPWSVPADFLVAGHTVQLLGPGGNGAVGTSGTGNTSGGGGGSGGYARLTYSSGTITPGTTTIAFTVPAGGTTAQTVWQTVTNGATAGFGGSASTTTGGTAGATGALQGAPTIVYTLTANFAGAAGGAGSASTGQGGGGGAGSSGPAAAGGTGSANVTSAGGGGGGANNGASGNATGSTTGGTGSSGTGGTTANPGNPGTGNSGGGGGSTSSVAGTNVTGGLGGTGTDFVAAGCGGGGGGSGANTATTGVVNSKGGNAGGFGGGGGGCGGLRSTGTPTFTVGAGTGGLIVINFASLLQQHTQITRFDAGPPLRPGQPERWKSFFDLANLPPVVTPLFRGPYFTRYVTPKAPEEKSNRTFFDLSTLYAQHPVGAQWEEQHRPVPRPGSPELWRSFFDLSNIPPSAQAPFVYYDFSAHPLRSPSVPNLIAQINLPQVYSAAPIGATSVEVHPVAPRGNPEPWKSFFDLSSIYAQAPVGATSVETHPLAPRGQPERWRPFWELAYLYAQSPVGAASVEIHPSPPIKGPEPLPPNLLQTTLGTVTIVLPFVYYDFSNHPPPPLPVPNVAQQLSLPQVYSASPIGATSVEVHPLTLPAPPAPPKTFFDLSSIYAQTPIGAASVEVHPLAPRGQPEPWKSFFDLSIIYAQHPVGAGLLTYHTTPLNRTPEWIPPYLLTTTLGIVVVIPPFVYYDFSNHPPPPLPIPNVIAQLSLPQVYAQGPVSRYLPDEERARPSTPQVYVYQNILLTTLSTVIVTPPFVYYDFSAHPLPPLPVPNVVSQLNLPQVYSQQPVGAASVEVHPAHPVARPGTPERWKPFFDLSVVYAQAPVGATSVETHPLAPKGNPERWIPFFDLSTIYAQGPVSRYFPDEARPLPVAPPPWIPPWLLETTLGPVVVTTPFVYYDFSAHPLPPLPVPNVAAQLNLPQVYSQKPVGQARLSFEATPVVRGQPERWKSFIDLSQIYTAIPVGTASLTINRTPPAQPAENVLYPDLVLLHGIAPPPPPTGVAFYMAGMFSSMALFPYLGEIPRFEGTGTGPTPANAYVAEDGATFYVAEDGTTFYVQE